MDFLKELEQLNKARENYKNSLIQEISLKNATKENLKNLKLDSKKESKFIKELDKQFPVNESTKIDGVPLIPKPINLGLGGRPRKTSQPKTAQQDFVIPKQTNFVIPNAAAATAPAVEMLAEAALIPPELLIIFKAFGFSPVAVAGVLLFISKNAGARAWFAKHLKLGQYGALEVFQKLADYYNTNFRDPRMPTTVCLDSKAPEKKDTSDYINECWKDFNPALLTPPQLTLEQIRKINIQYPNETKQVISFADIESDMNTIVKFYLEHYGDVKSKLVFPDKWEVNPVKWHQNITILAQQENPCLDLEKAKKLRVFIEGKCRNMEHFFEYYDRLINKLKTTGQLTEGMSPSQVLEVEKKAIQQGIYDEGSKFFVQEQKTFREILAVKELEIQTISGTNKTLLDEKKFCEEQNEKWKTALAQKDEEFRSLQSSARAQVESLQLELAQRPWPQDVGMIASSAVNDDKSLADKLLLYRQVTQTNEPEDFAKKWATKVQEERDDISQQKDIQINALQKEMDAIKITNDTLQKSNDAKDLQIALLKRQIDTLQKSNEAKELDITAINTKYEQLQKELETMQITTVPGLRQQIFELEAKINAPPSAESLKQIDNAKKYDEFILYIPKDFTNIKQVMLDWKSIDTYLKEQATNLLDETTLKEFKTNANQTYSYQIAEALITDLRTFHNLIDSTLDFNTEILNQNKTKDSKVSTEKLLQNLIGFYRAEESLANTAKQLFVAQANNFPPHFILQAVVDDLIAFQNNADISAFKSIAAQKWMLNYNTQQTELQNCRISKQTELQNCQILNNQLQFDYKKKLDLLVGFGNQLNPFLSQTEKQQLEPNEDKSGMIANDVNFKHLLDFAVVSRQQINTLSKQWTLLSAADKDIFLKQELQKFSDLQIVQDIVQYQQEKYNKTKQLSDKNQKLLKEKTTQISDLESKQAQESTINLECQQSSEASKTLLQTTQNRTLELVGTIKRSFEHQNVDLNKFSDIAQMPDVILYLQRANIQDSMLEKIAAWFKSTERNPTTEGKFLERTQTPTTLLTETTQLNNKIQQFITQLPEQSSTSLEEQPNKKKRLALSAPSP